MQTEEGRALGEGWSDAMALILTRKESSSGPEKVNIGTYVSRELRSTYYSTDPDINSLQYGMYNQMYVSHNRGQIWASTMYDLYWKLVYQYGFSKDITDTTSNHGNIQLLKLIILALKLAPCNPTYLQSRDGLIIADQLLFSGRNECLLWKVFSRRGMGENAQGYISGFHVPPHCP